MNGSVIIMENFLLTIKGTNPVMNRGGPPHLCELNGMACYLTMVENGHGPLRFHGTENKHLNGRKVKGALYAIRHERERNVYHLCVAEDVDRKWGKNRRPIHPDLFVVNGAAMPIVAAGHMDISKKGKVKWINGASGHYKPPEEQIQCASQLLKMWGATSKSFNWQTK
jgi:hypothetical protein